MTGKDGISDDDRALFRDSVGEVKRVRHDRAKLATPPQPPQRRKRLHNDILRPAGVLNDSFSDQFQAMETESVSEAGDELFFARQGVQRKALRRLKRGQLRCEEELDLHGLTAAEARVVLADFIAECRSHGLRNVRVIHGKGFRSAGLQPVLKGMVNNWLRQHDGVLAFCSARQGDGGTGAVYVLLKSQN